ncbi:MAG: Rieske 2Fe-2S domain-containing protein [Anaerolineaceae bacterium]|nr:Rieske 2Fe-2S domain-containing protein [Anaerolineaceae bacterium]
MSYVKIMQVDELVPGEKVRVQVEGKSILLVNLDGEFFALDNKCPHLGGSLVEGDLKDGCIVCPKHGAAFDVKTGENRGNAKIAFVKMKVADAKRYDLKIDGTDLLINLDN